jgi:hypothetical protein
MAPTDGSKVLGVLQSMWLGYVEGKLDISPDDMDPALPCDLAGVTPDLLCADEFGWTIHLQAGVVRYDWSWDVPYQLMSYRLWARYESVLDELRAISAD